MFELSPFIIRFGYFGLFLLSLLGASILPFSNEAAVLLMPTLGFNIWWVGIVATLGNWVGAYTVFWMGEKGVDLLPEKYRPNEAVLEKGRNWLNRWGALSLLLISIPIIGDPICLLAGSAKMGRATFLFWALIGKAWRYPLILGVWDLIVRNFV